MQTFHRWYRGLNNPVVLAIAGAQGANPGCQSDTAAVGDPFRVAMTAETFDDSVHGRSRDSRRTVKIQHRASSDLVDRAQDTKKAIIDSHDAAQGFWLVAYAFDFASFTSPSRTGKRDCPKIGQNLQGRSRRFSPGLAFDMNRLLDKVAIVFGAGPNIGGTVAHFFAREGARVAVCDVSPDAAADTVNFLTSRGHDAIALAGNAIDEGDVRRVIGATIARFGHLDIAMNMAGRVHWSHVLDMDLNAWKDAVLSFPTAGLLTTKHAAKAMIAGGRRGSIIHLLSTAAHFGEASGAAYTAAKAALLNFSRSAAMDLAHDGIRVNTITPCAMEHQLWTQMRDEVLDPGFRRPERASFYSRDDYLKMIPLERFPRASDLAWAAVFLASDEAGFLTGVDIPVDGGLRFKYPTWRPGEHHGVNIDDYARRVRITRYGEEQEKLID